MLLEFVVDLGLQSVVGRLDVARSGKAHSEALGNITRAQVGRHDDDGVLEVNDSTLTVGQTTVFKDLQQRVEDVGVCLLDLVEQDHRERLATHLLGQLATLVVTDVAGR